MASKIAWKIAHECSQRSIPITEFHNERLGSASQIGLTTATVRRYATASDNKPFDSHEEEVTFRLTMKSSQFFAVLVGLLLHAAPSSSFRNHIFPFTGVHPWLGVSVAPRAPMHHRRDGTKKLTHSGFHATPTRGLVPAPVVETRSTSFPSSKKQDVSMPEHFTVTALTLLLSAIHMTARVARLLCRLTQRLEKNATSSEESPWWPTTGRRVSIRAAIAIAVIASHMSHRVKKQRSTSAE